MVGKSPRLDGGGEVLRGRARMCGVTHANAAGQGACHSIGPGTCTVNEGSRYMHDHGLGGGATGGLTGTSRALWGMTDTRTRSLWPGSSHWRGRERRWGSEGGGRTVAHTMSQAAMPATALPWIVRGR
jgi:hypothetical protein